MCTSQKIFRLLQEYLIRDLTDLENLLEGQTLFVTYDEPTKDKYSDRIVMENGIHLEVDKVMLSEISEELILKDYSNYSFKDFNYYNEHFFQKLNYDDFLPHSSDFIERVNKVLRDYEEKIISELNCFLKSHLDNEELVTKSIEIICGDIKKAIHTLDQNFNETRQYKVNTYNNYYTHPIISEALQMVQNYMKYFIEEVEKEYQQLFNEPSIIGYQNSSIPDFFKEIHYYKKFLQFRDSFLEQSLNKQFTLYSFLFQRMKQKEIIHPISHKDFFLWLKKEELISEELMEKFLIDCSMISLEKSRTTSRDEKFDLIFSQVV